MKNVKSSGRLAIAAKASNKARPRLQAAVPIPQTDLRLRDLHRLIPSRHSSAGTVLERLSGSAEMVSQLMELDDSTNDRFLGEEGKLSGISIQELVFGVRYAHIVNAAFTHASPAGGRFNGPTRGAWYAAVERPTALAEVAFHRTRQLEEIQWPEPEVSTVDDYLADVVSPLHDLRSTAELSPFAQYLAPEPIPVCYGPPQRLAEELLLAQSNGVVYPSVRRTDGTCIACFRPALVYNVRRGARLEIVLQAGRHFRPSQAREVLAD